MIPKPTPKPTPTNPLHIYRALLRECTYLPDPAARTHWHARIVARFRESNPRTNTPWYERPKHPKRKPVVDPARRVHLLHTARKALSLLARANAGVSNCLATVLAHTYGRTGKRRHELLQQLAQLEEVATPALKDHNAVKNLAALLNTSDHPTPPLPSSSSSSSSSSTPPTLASFRTIPLPAPHQALLRAQRAQRLPNARAAIASPAPHIPEQNIWQRSFPIRRARNIQRRWRLAALATLLPPLPSHEFARLADLAAGRAAWEGVVVRRGGGGGRTKEEEEKEGGGGQGEGDGEEGGEGRLWNRDAHRLTPRYMRRHWRRVLVQCSMMWFEAGGERWKVQWGRDVREEELKREDGLGGQAWMFAGVDEMGRRGGGGGRGGKVRGREGG